MKMGHFRISYSNYAWVFVLIFCFTKVQGESKFFNIKDYGAKEGGEAEINEALTKAWNETCGFKGEATLEIPEGTYLVKPMEFFGPCTAGTLTFLLKGTLKAPPALQGMDKWLNFQYINNLNILGGGTFDGSGPPKQAGPDLPTIVKFNFDTNLNIKNVKLVNSMNTHMFLFACNDTKISEVTVSSPGDSPNTDGIKMGNVNGLTISNTTIASGDDCIAILPGTNNLTVDGVSCGPGHGISIGSMGGSPDEVVEHVTISNCNLTNTTNGVRIKTKATPNPGLVSDVKFEHLTMKAVENPILIEQNYCPSKTCGEGESKVKIKNVKYLDIKGTSKTAEAVRLECSPGNPCEEIELENIELVMDEAHKEKVATATAKCTNVKGKAIGTQIPAGCI